MALRQAHPQRCGKLAPSLPPHIPYACADLSPQIINAGDSMEMLSGGFYKCTIHRVVQPPPDQRDRPRLGAYYFALADDYVKLVPFTEIPVLLRMGIVRKCADEDAPTMREWRRGRVMAYGLKETTKRDDVVEEQIIGGIVLKHYN